MHIEDFIGESIQCKQIKYLLVTADYPPFLIPNKKFCVCLGLLFVKVMRPFPRAVNVNVVLMREPGHRNYQLVMMLRIIITFKRRVKQWCDG